MRLGAARAALLSGGARGASVDLNFVSKTTLDPRITFTRASSANYFDATGTLQSAATNVPRFDYGAFPGGVTNWVRNSVCAGSTPGTPGTAPTNWILNASGGLVWAIVGSGTDTDIPYVDIRISGTALGAGSSSNVTVEARTVIGATFGQVWTGSVYLKLAAGTLTNITDTRAYCQGFNSIGSFVESSASPAITLSGTWQRASSVLTVGNATTAFADLLIAPTITAAGAVDCTIRIGAPQIERAASAGAWVSTSGAAANSGATPLGLLIEESRTNSVRNGVFAGTVVGTAIPASGGVLPTNMGFGGASAGGLTVVINSFGTDAQGYNYIEMNLSGTTSSTFAGFNPETAAGIAASVAQVWTTAIYFKLVGGSLANVTNMQVGNVMIGGSGDIPTTFTPTASWTRVTATATAGAGTTNVRPYWNVNFSSGVAVNFTIRLGLPQTELGAFATSNIPTSGAATTRAADAASMSATSLIGQSQGTAALEFIEYTLDASATLHDLFGLGTTGSDLILSRGVGGGGVSVISFVANLNKGSASPANVVTVNATAKLAVAYTASSLRTVLNGGTVASGAITGIPAMTTVFFSNPRSGYLDGYLRRLRIWKRVLSDPELQQVTT